MFAGINMFLARLDQTHFKMRSEKSQKHIFAQGHQLYYCYTNFGGLLQH